VASEIFSLGGVKGHIFDGVFFCEGLPSDAQRLGPCKAQSNVQNTNLESLKRALAKQVKSMGGNALVNFKYAQKATVFSLSSVQWNASGEAARLASVEPPPTQATTPTHLAQFKKCPFCAEEVLAEARKCKHCGEFLE
jgi:hypothetical protein